MKKIERFDKYMEIKGLNDNKVTVQLGLSIGVLGKSRKEGRDLSDKVIEQILNFYTDLNRTWLLTGEGEMLNEAEKKENDNNCNESNCEDVTYVPLVPVASKGGDIDECTSSIRLADCEKILSPTPNAEIAITIRGDSMFPKYPNGTIAFIKEIDADLFIEWGRVYVLNTVNGSVTKVLTPSKKKGYIRCESINPDKKFAPFDVPMKSIKGIYKILLSLNPE